jgi:hypothetical protein
MIASDAPLCTSAGQHMTHDHIGLRKTVTREPRGYDDKIVLPPVKPRPPLPSAQLDRSKGPHTSVLGGKTFPVLGENVPYFASRERHEINS